MNENGGDERKSTRIEETCRTGPCQHQVFLLFPARPSSASSYYESNTYLTILYALLNEKFKFKQTNYLIT